MRSQSRLLSLCALAASAALLTSGSCPVKADTYTSADFLSPYYENRLGNYICGNVGRTATFTLAPIGTTTLTIDASASGNYDPTFTNADPPQVFTGNASFLFTLDGISHTLSDNYTLDGTTTGAKKASFLGGPAVLYDLGVQGNYFVTPIIGDPFRRINITSATADVPEPGSIALLVSFGLTGAGFLVRRRKQAHKAA